MPWNFYTAGGEVIDAAQTLDGYSSSDFVKIAGDTMSGSLIITGSGTATDDVVARNASASRVSIGSVSGGAGLTLGAIDGNEVTISKSAPNVAALGTGDKLQQSTAPTVNNDLTNKAYVDQPRVKVYSSGSYSVSLPASLTTASGKLTFDTKTSEAPAGSFTLASSLVTVPKAGYYITVLQVTFTALADADHAFGIAVNGTFTAAIDNYVTNIANGKTIQVVHVGTLNAGDTIGAYCAGPAGNMPVSNGAYDTYLSITRISSVAS